MTPEERLLRLLQDEAREQRYNRLAYMYPDEGPYRRELYPKHWECFDAGAEYRERGFMGGNGVGKTEGVGAYETALHLTGRYPQAWKGCRFDGPVDTWAAGKTYQTTRGIVQRKLFGNIAGIGDAAQGTGSIPRDAIQKIKITDGFVERATIRHVSGGTSEIELKSYEQGRGAYEGTNKHFIWLDEEPGKDIYGECIMRGRTVNGKILVTFTPLEGLTPLVEDFVNAPDERSKGRSIHVVHCDMDDVPHLTEQEKREMLAAHPVWQHKARKSGYPIVGEGLVFPVDEELIVVPPFQIPAHFRQVFGFDGGFHNTAVVWAAYDKDADTVYITRDYKRGGVAIPIHASAIKAQGEWIPGVGDVYATDQSDGEKVQKQYGGEGVDIKKADKAVDAGIVAMHTRMETGRLKVFSTCHAWLAEFRKYRYSKSETKFAEQSKIVKKDDHLMDATRYVIVSGLGIATTRKQKVGFTCDEVSFG